MITVMVIVLMVTIMIMVVMMVMVVMTMVLVLKIILSDTCSNGFAAADDNDQHESDIFNDSVDGNEDTGKIMEFFITEPTMGVG